MSLLVIPVSGRIKFKVPELASMECRICLQLLWLPLVSHCSPHACTCFFLFPAYLRAFAQAFPWVWNLELSPSTLHPHTLHNPVIPLCSVRIWCEDPLPLLPSQTTPPPQGFEPPSVCYRVSVICNCLFNKGLCPH